MIQFFWETDERQDVTLSSALPAIEAIIHDYQLKVEYVNMILMDDEQLLEINRQFLNHDYYTDIITFNYADSERPIEGELYISVDRVAENAQDMGVNLEEELFRVMIHGMLHLAGYDDSTDALRKEMQILENKYLKLIVPRETY